MTYLLNFLLVPLYYLVLRMITTKQKADRLFMWIVAIHAILFRALANPYNYVDTGNYVHAFKDISGWTLKHTVVDNNAYTSWGRGYLLYNWIVSRAFNEVQAFYFITGIISVGLLMAYYKKTMYTVLAPILFYLSYHMMYMHGFGVIRQHLAMPFLLFALYYVERPKVSVLFAVAATGLHPACLAFFPFYLMYWLARKMSFAELAGVCLMAFITARFFVTGILSFFPRYARYLNSTASSNIVPVLLTIFMLLLLYEADVYGKVEKRTDRNLLLFLIYGLGLSVFCIKLPGAGRLSLPVVYAVPVAMSLLYQYGGKKKDEYNLCVTGLAMLVVVGLYLAIENGRSPLLRYSLFWER